VEANPTQLASYGLTPPMFRQSGSFLQNADLAKGQISDGIVTAYIIAKRSDFGGEDYKPLVVATATAPAVRLSDVRP